jgi:hypothetical protein
VRPAVQKYGAHVAPDLTLEETFDVERLRRGLGVSPERMIQARRAIAAEQGGVASLARINLFASAGAAQRRLASRGRAR